MPCLLSRVVNSAGADAAPLDPLHGDAVKGHRSPSKRKSGNDKASRKCIVVARAQLPLRNPVTLSL